jgi:hypothetical protein
MKLKKDEPQLIPINWDKLWFIFFYDCLKFILNKNFHLVKYSQKADKDLSKLSNKEITKIIDKISVETIDNPL